MPLGILAWKPTCCSAATSFCRRRRYFSRTPSAISGCSRAARGRLLDGHELARIAIVLDVGERLHDLRMAGHERHAPADHVEALRHRMDLDADFLGPVHLQEAQRRTIVAQQDVGRVLDDDDLIGLGEVDDAAIEVARGRRRRSGCWDS